MKQFLKLFGAMGIWIALIGAVIQSGASTDIATVDPARKALRVATEANEALGHYSVYSTVTTGIATPGASIELFQFRNSTTTKVLIERITVQTVLTVAITTGQEVGIEVAKAVSWSAQGTGGTVVGPAFLERRDSMPTSAMASGDIRVATTAGLGAGTKSFVAIQYGCAFQFNAFTVGNTSQVCDSMETRDNKYPMFVLDQNEGFAVRNTVVWATGTGKWFIAVQWRELTTY